MLFNSAKNCAEALHGRCVGIREEGRKSATRAQVIAFRVFGHVLPIKIPDVFAPSENLSNETFRTIDGYFACVEGSDCRIENFAWHQQPVVEVRRQQ